jgi:hypothetical protein
MGTEARPTTESAPPERRPSSVPIPSTRLAVLACVALLLLPCRTHADSMRCGSRIVKDGDTMEKVLDVCGEPAKQERTWIQRAPQYELDGHYYSFPGTEEVPADVWTYDFGRNKLKQRVRFIDGMVDSIVTLTEKGE